MLEDATSLSEFFAAQPPEPGAVRASLGPRIRRARIGRLPGLNLEVFGREIAGLMGRGQAYSNVTISNWETGRQEPSLEALVAIARLTQLPLRYFAGVGEMDEYPRIDWLAQEHHRYDARLHDVLLRSSSLPPAARQLVAAQLKSLIRDIYRAGLRHG